MQSHILSWGEGVATTISKGWQDGQQGGGVILGYKELISETSYSIDQLSIEELLWYTLMAKTIMLFLQTYSKIYVFIFDRFSKVNLRDFLSNFVFLPISKQENVLFINT